MKELPPQCIGVKCRICGEQAYHKIEEAIFEDFDREPFPVEGMSLNEYFEKYPPPRHPFTAYICKEHFYELMGPVARRFFEEGHY